MAMAMHELIKLHAASHNITVQLYSTGLRNGGEQAGAELGQAQIKLGLGFTSIRICCIEFIYTIFYWLVLTPATA